MPRMVSRFFPLFGEVDCIDKMLFYVTFFDILIWYVTFSCLRLTHYRVTDHPKHSLHQDDSVENDDAVAF